MCNVTSGEDNGSGGKSQQDIAFLRQGMENRIECATYHAADQTLNVPQNDDAYLLQFPTKTNDDIIWLKFH